ncbi:hypothetical protein PYH37_001724 [Sinorhizobium numidicum]|uniref:Pectate lyase n=1 Tax=Sinorhizobium numidicum TaxID=680248 RepID=A0ABY8CSK3_9HYPH|nr:hypothetical protein [Sinorhizobium numidicum]WEX74319.1 hypothetical protein PYH37_001724 [Sinorhizobium numidicum]WEX80305.1 hypothetical protein PYH38_001725 [Sinorhizobium numidicum]
MRLFRGGASLIALVWLVVATSQSAQALDTFPGASGAGKATSGGRGGAVFIVTNTADTGTGSLRACMQATGARTCVFRVSGTIQLASPIVVSNGALTVAGQTSPGGIQIRLKSGIAATAAKTPVRILASNVFLRHLRVRPGNEAAWDSTRGSRSGIGIEKAGTVDPQNIYLDHMSVGYGSDQAMYSFQSGKNITIAYSLFAYPLSPANHDYGPLICSDQHQGDCGKTTLWRNIISSHLWRNPALKSVGCGAQNERVHDVINTLISNPGQFGIMVVDDHPDANNIGTCANVAASIMERGPKSTGPIALINQSNDTAATNRWYAPVSTGSGNDNVLLGSPALPQCRITKISPVTPCTETSEAAPIGALSAPVISTATLKSHLTQQVGAFPRDSLDAKWIGFVNNVSTAPATNPDYTSSASFPVITGGSPPIDSDSDGMPDSFELANGLSTTNAGDRNNIVPSGTYAGYTWLERYLDERHHTITPP